MNPQRRLGLGADPFPEFDLGLESLGQSRLKCPTSPHSKHPLIGGVLGDRGRFP